MSSLIKIGELSKRTRISVEALRFYETAELLLPKKRSSSGYRLYSPKDEQRLHFILHAKKIGFSLQEIKQLLSLRAHKDNHTCEDVKSYTGAKMKEIESKILDLQKMQQALTSLYQACCGGNESAERCTILSSLDDPELFSVKNNNSDCSKQPTEITPYQRISK